MPPTHVVKGHNVIAAIASRLICEEEGQDVIEYALLAAFFGIVGYLVMQQIGTTVNSTYSSWIDPTVGVPSLWDPRAPAGS